MKEQIVVPEKVKRIISIFEQNGYEAYAVGGCVRDSLLGRTPEDWDITTDASPKEIKGLFCRTVDTGIAHGTVTVLLGEDGFEVTTYRLDGKYEDSRHPVEVTFTKNLKEDLRRRDFTINAMAYNDRKGLVDCFEGRKDLEKGVIRCVGEPKERFLEDALRILRCLRFSAQLGFVVEEKTKLAAAKLAPSLQNISAERIQAEWTKLLMAPYADRIADAAEMGILKQFLPEIRVTGQLVQAVLLITEEKIRMAEQPGAPSAYRPGRQSDYSAQIRYLRYAMLFQGMETEEKDAPAMAGKLLRRLKFDNDTIRTVTGLVRFRDMIVNLKAADVRRAIHCTGEELFPLLLIFWRARIESGYQKGWSLEQLSQVEILYGQILERGDCLSLSSLAVNGSDLMGAGVSPGKEMGRILQRLLDQVLEDPAQNQKEILLDRIKKL